MIRQALAAAALVLLAVSPGFAWEAAREPPTLLDVPFVAQGPRLCGGAAAAMVLRYWGQPDVHSEDFAHLVHDGQRGIGTSDLTTEIERRGFRTHAVRGSLALVRGHLDEGRPLVLLVRSAARDFHYLVAVGITSDALVVHDPSVGAFRELDFGELDRVWESSGRWTLLVLPAGLSEPGDPTPGPTERGPKRSVDARSPCADLLARAARARDDLDEARALLTDASEACPEYPTVLRELAALRFREGRYRDAETLSERAARAAGNDAHAWALLGASRFLIGEREQALDAWNAAGQPRLDGIDVRGLRNTRQEVVYRYLDLEPRSLLTSDTLKRTRRRLNDLPAARSTRVDYAPTEGGRATLEASAAERERLRTGWPALVEASLDAAIHRRAGVTLASVTGGGERIDAGYRFWRHRPALWVKVAAPSLMDLPGVTTVETGIDEQTYLFSQTDSPRVRERRRYAALTVSDWVSAGLKLHATAGFDAWRERGSWVRVGAGAEQRLAGDHVRLAAQGSRWISPDGLRPLTSFGASAAAATAPLDGPSRLRGRVSLETVDGHAPFGLWPGAGVGIARPFLLRSEPLLDNGVVTGGSFGPRLAHVTVEAEIANWTTGLARFAVVTHADGALVWRPTDDAWTRRDFASVGAGLRVRVLGGRALRMDLARSPAGGPWVWSAGWVESF